MYLFRKLRKKLDYLDKNKIVKIYQAFQIAEQAHTGQKRSSGENYIFHPVAVAAYLANMYMDAESIMAALLHDVIEDTPVKKETLSKQFGTTVAKLVDGVTKLTKMNFSSLAEAQAESFNKMLRTCLPTFTKQLQLWML